ncbi:MAG: hypothetical protein V8T87_11985 [Victivallales bacterium]|nr:hypothetical protein [Lentisphaeria bacterium]
MTQNWQPEDFLCTRRAILYYKTNKKLFCPFLPPSFLFRFEIPVKRLMLNRKKKKPEQQKS